MDMTSILIVEDESIIARDLANRLLRLGYRISGITGSGEEAVTLARELRPDLVLMDIRLAGDLDGIEAAEIIRREYGLPVIFLTAHSDRPTLERAKLTEPFGYILKPFEETGLEPQIEMALYKHRAECRLRQANDQLELRVAERTCELEQTIHQMRVETAERLRAVEELREKERMLIHQSRMAAMGEMLGNIAHQWRQPLNALALLVQQTHLFYQLGELNEENLNDHTMKAMELISHMSRTIDDFRDFFRPDKQKVEFEVHQEVTKTLSLLEGNLTNQNIRIEVEMKDNPVIHGYPNEFCQVLLNILVNARDVVKERKIADPLVRISIGREGGLAVVTIADNAGGIPEDIIDRIFDPYFTTKEPGQGTGVGLFMSKAIIEKNMGGRLSVRNAGNGAEFRIEV